MINIYYMTTWSHVCDVICRVKWCLSRKVSLQIVHFSLSSRLRFIGSNSRLWCDLMWYTKSLVIRNDALHFAHQFCITLGDDSGMFIIEGEGVCRILSTIGCGGLTRFIVWNPIIGPSHNIKLFFILCLASTANKFSCIRSIPFLLKWPMTPLVSVIKCCETGGRGKPTGLTIGILGSIIPNGLDINCSWWEPRSAGGDWNIVVMVFVPNVIPIDDCKLDLDDTGDRRAGLYELLFSTFVKALVLSPIVSVPDMCKFWLWSVSELEFGEHFSLTSNLRFIGISSVSCACLFLVDMSASLWVCETFSIGFLLNLSNWRSWELLWR